MKGRLKSILGVFIALSVLAGCGSDERIIVAEDTEDDTIEIGMCFDSFVIERWEKDRDIFVSTASSLGATVNVQNANGNVDKQIEQIEYFVEKKVDCLVIIPIDPDAINEAVKQAKDEGIAVISYDRLINDCDVDLYISFDNYAVGKMMGTAIAGSGATTVAMLCGPLTDNNVPMIEEGFREVIDSAGIKVVDCYNVEGWKAELASAYVYDNGDIINSVDAIMCGNDDMATAVIRALAVSQLAGKKVVVGQDADLPACQHIVEGTQKMTVYKPVEKLATEAANYAVALAKGESIGVEETIDDGTYDVSYVAIEPVAVTKDNIDEVIINGGFHTREDVYLNVNNDASTDEDE